MREVIDGFYIYIGRSSTTVESEGVHHQSFQLPVSPVFGMGREKPVAVYNVGGVVKIVFIFFQSFLQCHATPVASRAGSGVKGAPRSGRSSKTLIVTQEES